MSGTMTTKRVYTYCVDEAELEVECPWYAEEVLYEVLISENCIILGVLGIDPEYPDVAGLDVVTADDLITAWNHNNMFGYGVWVYDINGHLITRDDECWGLIGREYAVQELKDAFDRVVAGRRK